MHWQSRKLVVTLMGMALISGLQYLGKLDGGTATALAGLVSGYLSANVYQKGKVPA